MKEFQRKGLEEMANAKSFSEREAMQNARTRKTSAAPSRAPAISTGPSRQEMESVQLNNERQSNPGQFDRNQQMYNSAIKMQGDDANYSPSMPKAPQAPQASQAPAPTSTATPARPMGMKKGGTTKKMASGGKTSSASSRADGIAQRGKTRGKYC